MNKIPVYLFLGFIEGGKTSFIRKALANKRFGNAENILLLLCEEGIEAPLPYYIDADTILIKDEDYAIWYSDIMNEAKKYNGKAVKFKAMISSRPELPNNVFAVGRYIMTCCEADMQFCRFVALCNRYYPFQGEK